MSSPLPLPVNPHNLVRVRKWVKVRAVIVTLCVREVMIFIPFLPSVSPLAQEQLGECAPKNAQTMAQLHSSHTLVK